MIKVAIPPASTPFLTSAGTMSPDWYLFFQQFLNRTGGTAQDLVAESIRVEDTGIVVCTDPLTSLAITRVIAAGTGIDVSDGNGIAGNPSIAIADTEVTPGAYGDATHVAAITVNQRGQVTAAAATAITYPPPVKLGNVYVAGALTATGYISMKDSAGTDYKVLVST